LPGKSHSQWGGVPDLDVRSYRLLSIQGIYLLKSRSGTPPNLSMINLSPRAPE
jgi:hypothetical protein